MPVDPATATAGVKLAIDLLQKLLGKLQQPKPDVGAAMSLIPQLQQSILQLQQTVYELQSENLQLKSKPNFQEAWSHVAAQYELKEVYPGTRLYVARDGSGKTVCQKCFDVDHKDVTLQQRGNPDYLGCVACNTHYRIAATPEAPVRNARRGP
jgi:hypothetical protein